MEEKPQQDDTMKYFRSRIRGNSCENCGHIFEDSEIIFTPEQVAENGEKITRYFCGSPMKCLENYKSLSH